MKKKPLLTGLEFKSLYNDKTIFNGDWYIEDECVEINLCDDPEINYILYGDSLENIPDDAKIRVLDGYLVFQGIDISKQNNPPMGTYSFEELAIKWYESNKTKKDQENNKNSKNKIKF